MQPEGTLANPLTSDGEDTVSTSSEDDNECDGAVVLHEDDRPEVPSFGNISVMNSNDIHFGNKTFYQGPVTIKQFLYANGKTTSDKSDSEVVLDATTLADSGLENPTFVNDNNTASEKTNAASKPAVQENSSGIVKGFRRLQKFFQENVVILVSLLAVLIVSLAILMVVLLLRHSPNPIEDDQITREKLDEQEKNTPVDSPIDPQANLTLPPKLKLVSRLEWLAQPPVQPANPLAVPVPYVIILHTATENCSSQAQCIFHVRFIQTFHIESRSWWDIGYNFLVGGDGEAYEGRGWKSEGAHTYGYNAKSIGIAFIGTFNSFKPPERQITACKQLIAKGVELGFIRKDYKLLAHRQLETTQSPGAALYEEMKTWEHWAKTP
ncbi:Peptidoglycan-recognition protein LE-like Protein [Tribolium castaneum]|uniref:Peptidoglycan-recognition protein LE-like Protein n=2 Tax=Tribolium castaneum TaxID=7070 RepID=D6WIN7_TRICA|nr:PREDICTED: peptidoglycan-recognition protein LE [Tribolium castaneum]EFA01280.1 Peptidoglycan-recognition protein LE-like Protein [Tribolium castaneum]|eukprot:XP_008192547.1 PREDICTED: peptidoglycan-recognition protein LE [Tribolium castaneum]